MRVDPLFFAAITAFGWGLSLATYRVAARRLGWPMGVAQARHPKVAGILGASGMIAGLAHAALREGQLGLMTLLVAGALFGLFWLGFLRVASQTSLLLTPLAILVLWLGAVARVLG
jgi:heme/copper-type cytochrome/quinol oxidase subunit 3